MSKRKKHINKMENASDLAFTFTGCKFNVAFEPETLSEDTQETIIQTIQTMSEEIYIDKSYVKCKGNKHDDVFLSLEGWNCLMTMLDETNYGDDATKDQYDVIVDFYYTMALGYMYNIINTLYPEAVAHVMIETSSRSNMEVDILEDTAHEWKTYPGKWQTWKKNN